ncbi:hypothetical protein [Aeromonas veronii]|uniref:hypothetical protein n=1 Tax=Aeromonas veronii TaxID=654 RepID=UPI001F17AD40|nr:hypothetical protein [Aeromonas veronii]MCF5841393.1 hypothetical protein [Aeromonas veronii]MCF5889394.1 hypothetical protein [Aeromonas veronii]
MKARVIYLFCFLGLSSQISFGSDTGSQVPPRTEDYPAPPVYKGKPAKLSLDSELARTFRTRLTAALSQKPVYAGEYVLTGWGCGSSGCYDQVLVNKRTGKVLDTVFNAYSSYDVNDKSDTRVGEWIESPQIDSRLLTTVKVENSQDGKHFVYYTNYYIVDKNQLTLIKTVQDSK